MIWENSVNIQLKRDPHLSLYYLNIDLAQNKTIYILLYELIFQITTFFYRTQMAQWNECF